MRPIHFSWDQAVILCDNKKCKSILCASPSDCIIKKELLQYAQEPFSALDPPSLLSDGSGGSSSGIYSEARSSISSPAQSQKSITDEEVELLLKSSYSPLNFKNHVNVPSKSSDSVSHTKIASEKHSDHSYYSRYDGFFELLGNLDLEPPIQLPNTVPHTESSSVETSLDFVTTELEGWMRDFEFPSDSTKKSSIISDDCQQASDEVSSAVSSDGCYQFPGEVVNAESFTKKLHTPCIPSHRSAFSLVDILHEESASFNNDEQNSSLGSLSSRSHSLSSEKNETSELIVKCENLCVSVPFVKENLSTFPTRFMSPTASAASEDSGYNEEDGKSSCNLELAAGEGNGKLSSKTLMNSSLKNVDDTTKCISIKQSQQINFEKLIHNSLDWPEMSDMHTLTVLPAMVTTENNFRNRPQESLSVSSITQNTSSEEICVTEQDERERINFGTEQRDGGLQIPIESSENHEYVSVFSENDNCTLGNENHSISISDDHESAPMENHDHMLDVNHGVRILEDHEHSDLFSKTDNHVLADESHTVSISESYDVSLISQSADCLVSESEGSSHLTYSEAKNVSEDNANSANSLDTSNETLLGSEEDKNKRGKGERNKNNKFRNSCDRSVRCVPSDNDGTVPNSSESRIRNRISGIKRDVKRRKCKIPGHSYNKGSKQNLPLKRGNLKKSQNREKPKRSAMAYKVLPRLSKHKISSLRNQPSTSSGKNLYAKNDAEELHESDKKNLTAQNPGWQIPEGRTSSLCRRVTNLSPRKLLVGQMNRDPWSVTDLYLEEIAIEVIVQDKQEASHHSDQAAKCDMQLQDLFSLFGKEQTESKVSNLSTSEPTLALSSNINSEMLEKDNKVSYESERIKVEDDSENLSINHEQITQNFSAAEDSRQKEFVDSHEIKQENVATNMIYKEVKGENSSQCDIIDKSHPTNMILEGCQSLQKVDSNSENLSVQKSTSSEPNEETSLAVEIDSNSFIGEEVGLLKQQLISNTHESMHTSSEDDDKQIITHSQETPFNVKQLGSSISESLEEDNNKQIVSGSQETSMIVKESYDKTQNETNHDFLTTENSKLNMENCVIQGSPDLPFSFDKKSTFELPDKHYIDGYTSDLNTEETCKYTNPWFEKVYEKEKNMIEKQNSCTSEIMSCNQLNDIDRCSSDMYHNISPQATSHYFFNNQKFGSIRSWIGDSDDSSLTGNELRFKEIMVRNNIQSKSEFSSSKYFQSLVEDMEVDENFLQCPIDENPSETFFEHFRSPLFFGETASNSTVHIDVPEVVESDFIYRDWSESSSKSKSFFQTCDQHLAGSVTSAACTQVSRVPLPTNMALVPITSVPSNVPSPEVLSVIRKQNLGKETIIPNNPQITHILTLPNVNVPFDGLEPSLSILKLPSESLLHETSVTGSSGDLNVRGKKLELTSKSIKCVSELEIDTSKKLNDQKQDFALECAATSSSGNGTDLENFSDVEQVSCNTNSKKSGALSDCSPQDILGKESRLDILKIKSKSSILRSKEILLSPSKPLTLPSKPLTLVQTSSCYCSAGIKNCRTCYCNLGNREKKTENTMACKDQIECQQYSLSDLGSFDLDDDSDRALDTDNEIHITIPKSILEHSCNPREGDESFTIRNNDVSEKYLVDVPVDQCSINEDIMSAFNFDEIEKPELSFTKEFNHGLKRKTDDDYEGHEGQKRFKSLNTTIAVRGNEYIPQNENQSLPYSNSQHNLYMCGILDNSVPHDKYCCSSLHHEFDDNPYLPADKENAQQIGKTYASSRKLCRNNDKSKDAAVYDILKSCIAKDCTENDYSVCSNAKENTTHKVYDQTVFDDDVKFGSMKASPQYDSHSCLRVETGDDSLSFFQFDSVDNEFLGLFLSPTESNSSIAKSVKEEEDSEHFSLLKSNANLEPEKQENTCMEKLQQNMLNEEILHSASDCTSLMDNGDDLDDKRNIVPSCIPSTADVSRNVSQSSASCEEIEPLLKSKCSSVDYKESPSFPDAIELNQGLNKTSLLKRSQLSLPPSGKTVVLKSSQPFGKTVILKSSQSIGKTIVLKSSQTSSNMFVLKSSQPSNKIIALKSSPSVSSHNCDRSNRTKLSPLPPMSSHVYPGNQNVTGATVSQSFLLLPSQTKENKVNQSLPVAPFSLALSGTTTDQMISSDVQKPVSLIDYQTPVSANSQVIVPPALATNYRDSSSTIAQDSHIPCPVDNIVTMVASTPIAHDSIQVKRNALQKEKEKNLESYPNYDNNQESSSMLKMIKLGSNGQFYMRPSSALKNAISEMRKKNIEYKEEKETSSGYLTLPDGNPIPPPIFIPSKKVAEVQAIKPKRKRRRKRCINRIKTLLTEKIKESFEFNDKNEIPKVIVVYTRGSLHICQIDVSEDR
ncbi:uncharacterized protein LOC123516276 isoform X2 [Portunus trituberculatus]|nr:uncharacterized protein LOC123516276 isoform X2 [Portunus trituberculatus]